MKQKKHVKFKMFLQKVKAAPYIEAESFVNFIGEFSKVIRPYLEKKQTNFLSEMKTTFLKKTFICFFIICKHQLSTDLIGWVNKVKIYSIIFHKVLRITFL